MSSSVSSIQQRVFEILDNKSRTWLGRSLEFILLIVILLNIGVAIFETLPVFTSLNVIFLQTFISFSALIFLVEYILRIWTAPLCSDYPPLGRVPQRIRFLLRPMLIIDLVVLISLLLHLFFPFNAQWMRIFRFFRVFKVFRVATYSEAIDHILSVVKKNKEELVAVFSIMFVVLLLSSTILYFVEQSDTHTKFTSIPTAFWWGISTLTTVGYGDITPITPLGRFFGAITAIMGVGIFALPTGLLGASFYHDVSMRREREMKRISGEIESLRDVAIESGEMIEQVVRRQERKIRDLEEELEFANKKIFRLKKKFLSDDS